MTAYIHLDNVKINDYFFPTADSAGSGNYIIASDGSGQLSFKSIAGIISTFSQSETVSSSKTEFTVTSGYLVGNLDVYYNGLKLLEGDDYTATDGEIFTLTEAAAAGDIVEWNGMRYPQSHVSLSGAANNSVLVSNGSSTVAVAKTGLVFDGDNLGIKTSSPSAILDINGDKLRLQNSKTPTSASDTGSVGDICWDSNYIYVCVSDNTWKRSSLNSW